MKTIKQLQEQLKIDLKQTERDYKKEKSDSVMKGYYAKEYERIEYMIKYIKSVMESE